MSSVRLIIIVSAVASAIVAFAILIVLAVLRRRTGFAFSSDVTSVVVASDVGAAPSQLLRDPTLGISGKPDYLVETDVGGRRLRIPIEVKPTRRSQRLYDTDRFQIGAYLIALRGSYPDRAAGVGQVRYAQQTFNVALSPKLEQEVAQIATAVRRGRHELTMHRSHNIGARCSACPVRPHCNEAIVE